MRTRTTILTVGAMLAGLVSSQAVWGMGVSSGSAVLSLTVVNSVAIVAPLSSVQVLHLGSGQSAPAQTSDNFMVKTNSRTTHYDVWLTGSTSAVSGNQSIPVQVSLDGNTGTSIVHTSAFGRPLGKAVADGHGVSGTNLTGTVYQLVIQTLGSTQKFPPGNYSVAITAHVALSD